MKDIKTENFRFSTPIYIRWNDLDPIGHVNNVIYFDYFQSGRGLYMLHCSQNWDWTQNMFVIAHIEADFISELDIRDKSPKVWVRTAKIGAKSFDFEYLITSEKDGQTHIHATGKSTQVLIDLAKKRSIEIPDWLRQDIQEFESAL